MDALPPAGPSGQACLPTPIERARRYLELARSNPGEAVFWLCRAAYFGRMSVRH